MSTVQPRRGSLVILFALGVGLAGCESLRTAAPPSAAALAAAPPTPTVAAVVPERVPRPAVVLEPIPEPTDLLSRLRENFALETASDPTVERELAWYVQNPEYLERVFTRGARYLYYITEELERRGMPADLALLPVVESAFDPFAYSHGRASGLWQIIPGTGRRLGLAQNWWFDGRRDVVESTRAALDYLEALHLQLGGDWLLAVAGYNSGEGNVARALKRAQAAGEPTDFWGIRRYLPIETRTYVPRLIAIRALVAAPEAQGVALPEIANAPYFSIVETGGQIDMALAAELSALDLDQLYELNPGINRWATDP
ncbi:MAG TPA: transglycosylase SLT domain-containing protein, partial [Gammaproteobacteria bacterium]